MTILLPTLAVAFAAFCIWLTARIVNRRERWAKWTLTAIMLLAYPISIGPANWIAHQLTGTQKQTYMTVYAATYSPITWTVTNGPKPIRDRIVWYCALWQPARHSKSK